MPVALEACWLPLDSPYAHQLDQLGKRCGRKAKADDWISYAVIMLCGVILVICFVGWIVLYSRKASKFREFWDSEDHLCDDEGQEAGSSLEMKPSFTSSSSSHHSHSRTPSVVHTLSTVVPTLLVDSEPQPKHPPSPSPSKIIRHTSRAPSITSLSVDNHGSSTMKKRSPLGSTLPAQARLSTQSVTVTIASDLGVEASRASLWDARSFGSTAQISSEASHRQQSRDDIVRGGVVPSRQWGDSGDVGRYGHQGLASPGFSIHARSEKAPVMMGLGGEGSQSSLSEVGRGWLYANAALSSPAPSPAPGVAPDPNWGGGRQDDEHYSEISYAAPSPHLEHFPPSPSPSNPYFPPYVPPDPQAQMQPPTLHHRTPSQVLAGNFSRPQQGTTSLLAVSTARPLSTRLEEPEEEGYYDRLSYYQAPPGSPWG